MTPLAASQIFVILEIVIFNIAARGLFRLSRARQDLNSGHDVSDAKTRNPITPFGALECSAAKETTGSRKYPAPNRSKTAGMSQRLASL